MAKLNAATSNLIDLDECMTECVLVYQWIRMFVHVYIWESLMIKTTMDKHLHDFESAHQVSLFVRFFSLWPSLIYLSFLEQVASARLLNLYSSESSKIYIVSKILNALGNKCLFWKWTMQKCPSTYENWPGCDINTHFEIKFVEPQPDE